MIIVLETFWWKTNYALAICIATRDLYALGFPNSQKANVFFWILIIICKDHWFLTPACTYLTFSSQLQVMQKLQWRHLRLHFKKHGRGVLCCLIFRCWLTFSTRYTTKFVISQSLAMEPSGVRISVKHSIKLEPLMSHVSKNIEQ